MGGHRKAIRYQEAKLHRAISSLQQIFCSLIRSVPLVPAVAYQFIRPITRRILVENSAAKVRVRHGGVTEAVGADARVDAKVRQHGIAVGQVLAAVLEGTVRVPGPGADADGADACRRVLAAEWIDELAAVGRQISCSCDLRVIKCRLAAAVLPARSGAPVGV